MSTSNVCQRCRTGQHRHSLFTDQSPEVHAGQARAGDPAECPYLAALNPATGCDCGWRGGVEYPADATPIPPAEPAPGTLPVTVTDPAYTPTRAHAHDAGLDLTAALDLPSTWLVPGETTVIDTGVAVAIPPGHVGLIALRSSLGRAGVQLVNGVGIIDAGYRGQIKVILTVVGEDYRLDRGDRIAQLLLLPILLPTVTVVDHLPPSPDGRGEDGFGSTGRGGAA